MNTIAFNILLVIYSILFVLCIALWIQARKTDAYIKANNPAQRKYVITIVVGISLLVTSALLSIGSTLNKKMTEKAKREGTLTELGAGKKSLTVVDAITVGLTQVCAAIFPGLSRSGSTLAAGQMRGVNRQTALDFTFVMAIPSILAAAVLELSDALSSPEGIGISIWAIVAGMIASAVVGYFSIVLFKWLLKTNKMLVFIAYTAVVGVAVIVVSIIEANVGHNLFA